jgi:hypothetical protein
METMTAEERHAQIVARLEGNELETDDVSESVEAVSETESDVEASAEEEEAEEYEASEVEDDEEHEAEEGHRVPYQRFKQINDRKRELQEQLAAREQAIAELEERLKGRQQPEPEEETVQDDDYYFNDFAEEEQDPNDWSAKLNVLEQQNRDMQVKFATMELEKEIASARQEFPDVPEEYLWETIAQNGNVSARNAAAHYTEFVAGIEEAAIAKYLKEQGAAEPQAPPRPSRKQTAASGGEEVEWKPRTTDEAREAMLAYLRS